MSMSQTDGLRAGLADQTYTTMEVISCKFLKMPIFNVIHPKATAATYLMQEEKQLNFVYYN